MWLRTCVWVGRQGKYFKRVYFPLVHSECTIPIVINQIKMDILNLLINFPLFFLRTPGHLL